MNRCLVCYKEVETGKDYHDKCSIKLFGVNKPLMLAYGLDEMKELAKKAIASQTNITGIQAKISLAKINTKGVGRLTVDLNGQFILKPPTEKFPEMPENEALTMELASVMGLATVPHGLIKLSSGQLAYITKRIDRFNGKKIHQEDLCQLSERLSEDKYNSTAERVGKVIKGYVSNPGLAMVDYFSLLVFSFWVWNTDMHMKNYSLIKSQYGYILCPAYDLLNVKLLVPKVAIDTALKINGKDKNLTKKDFDNLAGSLQLTNKQRDNTYKLLLKGADKGLELIGNSYLSDEHKELYKEELIKQSSLFL